LIVCAPAGADASELAVVVVVDVAVEDVFEQAARAAARAAAPAVRESGEKRMRTTP
jgi:hypothetical protein